MWNVDYLCGECIKCIHICMFWSVEHQLSSKSGVTPLHVASMIGSADVCRLLIEAGGSVRDIDEVIELHEI